MVTLPRFTYALGMLPLIVPLKTLRSIDQSSVHSYGALLNIALHILNLWRAAPVEAWAFRSLNTLR